MRKETICYLKCRVEEYRAEKNDLDVLLNDYNLSIGQLRPELEKMNHHVYLMEKMIEWGFQDIPNIINFLKTQLADAQKKLDIKQSEYDTLYALYIKHAHRRDRISSESQVFENAIRILSKVDKKGAS